MAAGAERYRHRYLFPDQWRCACADHAVAGPRGDPRRHRSRRLFRRNGRDRWPTSVAGILAVTDATIARMPATVFREIIHKYPDVAEQLLLQLVSRIRTLDQRVNEFSSMHVKNRIYAELLRRSRPDPTDQRRAIISPPPVHSDIAARVSTRREMVARELKALERAGFLTKRRGAFVLTNVPELMQMLHSEK